MKKIYLSLIIALATHQFASAQWTVSSNNTYYNLTGNVGIGNQTPNYKLDVAGMLSSSLNGQAGVHIYNGGGVSEWLLQQKSQSSSNFTISSLVSGNQYDFMIIGTNGNIGVGTSNLQAKFNVYQSIGLGSTPQNSSLLNTVSGLAGTGNNFQNNIWLVRNASGSDWYTTRLHDGLSIDGSFQSPQVNTLCWWERDPNNNIQSWGNANNTYMTINAGNVLIGKTSQTNTSYKLDIAGNVRANSIVINSTGADFVFEPTYKLRPLADLKTYIDQNHHLPEIESAKQMQTKGLNVGDNQTKLLQKIEELTLYVIQLKEKNDQLKNQNDQLKAQQQSAIVNQSKITTDQEGRIHALETKLNQLLNTNH